ncbi:MAG: transcription antitermination factor NusB [Clostridiales bacterium]|nr:transcription antitermination factor NusB [Clostridiales bacterium]
MSRVKSREYAFRLVFEKFFHEPDDEFMFNFDDLTIDDGDKEFVNHLIGTINTNYDEIMQIIKDNTVGYELDRIYKVDLAILVLAVCELKFISDTPTNVVINEAVEIAKKYSTDKSYSFVNGVLAKVIK